MFVGVYHALTQLRVRVHGLVESEIGASLVEYALLLALIAIVCLVAVVYFGSSVSSSFSHTGSAVGSAGP